MIAGSQLGVVVSVISYMSRAYVFKLGTRVDQSFIATIRTTNIF